MDTRQRTHRRLGLAAALLTVLALGSAPAVAQVPPGPAVTIPPLPIDEGDDGSTPVPSTSTTTTTAPGPTTTTTTASAPAVTTTTATEAPATTTAPAAGAPIETPRRGAGGSGRRMSARATAEADQPLDVAPAAVADEPTITRLREVTLPAARQFGFPLALAVLVLAFLAVQGRLDARDPKLAVAPVSVDDDLLPFT